MKKREVLVMPAKERFTTKYPGVFFVEGTGRDGQPERIYYYFFRKDGRQFEEKAGRAREDAMTPAKAARIRAERIEGKRKSRKEVREEEAARKAADANRWTIERLWAEYKRQRTPKGLATDENRYQKHIAPVFAQKEPQEILQLDVDRQRIRLSKRLSPQTVKHVLSQLQRIINFGAKKGLCPALPCPSKLKCPASTTKSPKT